MVHSHSHSHSHSFHVASHSKHLKWDNSLKPVLTVESGSEVSFDLVDGGNNQFTAESTTATISTFDFSLADPATGPVYINSTLPGDVLQIDILALTPASYGWTAIFPSSAAFGLLCDEFPSPCLKIWDLATNFHDGHGYAEFKKGIHVPITPFLGVMGVAREEEGEWSTIPPYETGGNVDCRYLTVGTRLFLPVKVEGALFSCGDGHAAQGDGEVCGTAIETPMRATLRFTVLKNKSYITTPHFQTPSFPSPTSASPTNSTSTSSKAAAEAYQQQNVHRLAKGEYAAMGIDADMREASRKAVRAAIAWLCAERGLSREEAYMLCSVVGDLRVVQAVDMPHYGVICAIPLSIFVDTP